MHMYFKPALATAKVTLVATSYIRFASKIEEQQSIDITSLRSGRLHKLHITDAIEVKQGQALVAVYSPELADNYASTQANLQQTLVTLTTEQLLLSRHQKWYGLNARYCSRASIYRLWLAMQKIAASALRTRWSSLPQAFCNSSKPDVPVTKSQ